MALDVAKDRTTLEKTRRELDADFEQADVKFSSLWR